MAIIKVSELRKTYRSGLFGKRVVEALRGVNLEVEQGEVFGILGPNGAGKTTIVKILMGLIGATSGSAEVLGFGLGSRAVRRKLGYLPEHHRFPGYLTGSQALHYYGQLAGMSAREVKAREDEVLDRVGMREWKDSKLREYSKGMGQRLGLAQAMIHDPEIYFLDEPTDGVDPVGRAEIREILKRLSTEGKTVFINSHLLQEVELVCDRVSILTRGQVLKTGTMREITSQQPQSRVVVDRSVKEIQGKIDELLGESVTERVYPEGDGREVELVVPGDDQERLDKLVDLLRAEKFSLRALIPLRLTLEEAFLEAVGERQVGGSQGEAAPAAKPAKVMKAKIIKSQES